VVHSLGARKRSVKKQAQLCLLPAALIFLDLTMRRVCFEAKLDTTFSTISRSLSGLRFSYVTRGREKLALLQNEANRNASRKTRN
jgi:hypothetical protein